MKLINQSKLRRFILEYASANRHHKFTRVSKATLLMLEARLRAAAQAHVASVPSKGRTL